MRKRRLEFLIEEELYSKVLDYQENSGMSSTTQALNSLLESQLNNTNDPIMIKLDELEEKLNENTKASYASLDILCFLYKDFCALCSKHLKLSDARFKYWANKTPKAICMFFRRAGAGAMAFNKFYFWKNFKFAVTEKDVRDGNSEQLLGLPEHEFSKLVTGTNDANAIRTRTLENNQ